MDFCGKSREVGKTPGQSSPESMHRWREPETFPVKGNQSLRGGAAGFAVPVRAKNISSRGKNNDTSFFRKNPVPRPCSDRKQDRTVMASTIKQAVQGKGRKNRKIRTKFPRTGTASRHRIVPTQPNRLVPYPVSSLGLQALAVSRDLCSIIDDVADWAALPLDMLKRAEKGEVVFAMAA